VYLKKRDLRSGKSFWQVTDVESLPSISLPKKFYDVVIIGAGISGAMIAEKLSHRTRDILVIDKRGPAEGSTTASTALIQWEIDTPLTKLARKIGRHDAILAYRESFQAVQKLGRMIKNRRISCDYRKRQTLLLAGSEMGRTALAREAKMRQHNELPSRLVLLKELKEVYGFDREAAIESLENCEVNPRKLTIALLKIAARRGVHILFPETVDHIDATRAGVFITMGNGNSIACRKLVVATGYETLTEIPKSGYELVSTWALASKPLETQPPYPFCSLIWEASDPYLYFRTTTDGRIIAGGEDEAFIDPARREKATRKKTVKILQKLRQLLPNMKLESEFAWSGTFATSPTGLPIIGEMKQLPNVFAILGAGGNGITFSVIARDLVCDWIEGRESKLSKLFAP
jgi:glycine/D-amino acid oxidase-like deaminating enzyme